MSPKTLPAKTLLDTCKESLVKKSEISIATPGSSLSEPSFLYTDLLKKRKAFEKSNETGGDLSAEDTDDSIEKDNDPGVGVRKKKFKDYDFLLSKATVYSKKEIIKIFECKMLKLDILYKKQLEIIGDKIMVSRKEYLSMKDNESKAISIPVTNEASTRQYNALNRYKKQSSLRVHLQKKFTNTNEITEALPTEATDNTASSLMCQYQFPSSTDPTKILQKCLHTTLPLSNYCQKHILSDPKQILFHKCPGNVRSNNLDARPCQKALIESIGIVCPIHISNKFIECDLDLTEEEMDNPGEEEDVKVIEGAGYLVNAVQNDEAKLEISRMVTGNECDENRMRSMINNIKLISVIKQESFDD